MVTNGDSAEVWDGQQCAVLLMDYQDNILGNVFEQTSGSSNSTYAPWQQPPSASTSLSS